MNVEEYDIQEDSLLLLDTTLLSLLLVSSDVDPALFVLDLHMKYAIEMVPLHTYI